MGSGLNIEQELSRMRTREGKDSYLGSRDLLPWGCQSKEAASGPVPAKPGPSKQLTRVAVWSDPPRCTALLQ